MLDSNEMPDNIVLSVNGKSRFIVRAGVTAVTIFGLCLIIVGVSSFAASGVNWAEVDLSNEIPEGLTALLGGLILGLGLPAINFLLVKEYKKVETVKLTMNVRNKSFVYKPASGKEIAFKSSDVREITFYGRRGLHRVTIYLLSGSKIQLPRLMYSNTKPVLLSERADHFFKNHASELDLPAPHYSFQDR